MSISSDKLQPERISQLEDLAQEAKIKVIEMLEKANSGHPAGSLGMADVFTVLYFQILKFQANNPHWEDRDYLLLSNGHICPILYAVLNMTGFFPAIELNTLRKIHTRLQGHPHLGSLPGLENTSGPLGQGISQACGLALALKRDKKKNRVFCITSDGEHQEGQTWESYLFAAKYQLDNLTIIIDRNFIQIEGNTEKVMPLENLRQKIEAFGIQTYEIDGHDIQQIFSVCKVAIKDGQPSAIIANTIPGKGVDFMENKYQWHGRAPNKDEAKIAIDQLKRPRI
ncbi:MAG: Transketolase domain protein, partial [Microgenomates bacterium 39_7]